MSNGFQASEHIARPVEQVWAGLTDWRQAPRWMNGIDQMQGPAPEAAAEGAGITFHARGAERKSTIKVWSPPRRLVLHSRQGGVTATYEYTCEPEGEGTRCTLHARCETQGIAWRLAGPLIRYLMKKTDRGQVSALKRVLESPSHR